MALLRNLGHDYRRRKATRALPTGETLDLTSEPTSNDIEEAEYRCWVIRRGMELIRDDFSETTWQAFEAVMIAGRPAAEVAAELGLSINSVYLSRHRILARLREELGDLLD